MCAWVTLIAMGLLLHAAYRFRDHSAASILLASAALYPVGLLLIWVTLASHTSASLGEALPAYLLISLILNLPVALVLGSIAKFFFRAKEPYWQFAAAGVVVGLCIAPYHFLLSTTPGAGRQPFPVSLFLLTDAIVMGLALPWMLVSIFDESRLASLRKLVLAATLVCIGLGIYIVPNVAFRTYGLYAPLGWLERIGARRALMFGGPEGQKATLALAHAGDQLMLEKLRKNLLDGQYEPGPLTGTEIVVEQMSGDPQVRQALLDRLDAALKTYKSSSTFGDEYTNIVSLCENLGKMRDPYSVPTMIRVYRLPTEFVNFKLAAAKALGRIGGPEASAFVVAELKKLHPNLDRQVAQALGEMDDPQVKQAMADYEERGKVWRENQRLKDTPIASLAQSGNDKALLARALDPRGRDRGKAAIALVKKGHPQRVKAILAAIQDLVYYGKELQGVDDPELFKALSAKVNLDNKNLDLRLGRFVADWAPPGSEKLLEKLLIRFSLQPAADGLGRLGTPEAAKDLLRELPKTDGSFQLYIIRALGMTKQPVTEKALLKEIETPAERAPLVADGSPIYPNDVAARALKELGTPKAMAAIESYRYQGDPIALEKWWGR